MSLLKIRSARIKKHHRRKAHLHNAEQNSALRIPNSALNPKLPNFFRQPFYTLLVFPRKVIYLLYGVVNPAYSGDHFICSRRLLSAKKITEFVGRLLLFVKDLTR